MRTVAKYVRIRALISRFDLRLASLCDYIHSSWQSPDAPFGDTSLSFGDVSLPFAAVMLCQIELRSTTSEQIYLVKQKVKSFKDDILRSN